MGLWNDMMRGVPSTSRVNAGLGYSDSPVPVDSQRRPTDDICWTKPFGCSGGEPRVEPRVETEQPTESGAWRMADGAGGPSVRVLATPTPTAKPTPTPSAKIVWIDSSDDEEQSRAEANRIKICDVRILPSSHKLVPGVIRDWRLIRGLPPRMSRFEELSGLLECGACDEVLVRTIVSTGSFELKRSDLQSLCEDCWINDEVVNAYMGLVCVRSRELASGTKAERWPWASRKHVQHARKCTALSSFFFTKLVPDGTIATCVGRTAF